MTLPKLLWRAVRLAWRALRAMLLVIAVLVMFIEEWGWRPLAAWAARLAQWPPLARLEARIRQAPPRLALALFLVPALLLFPIKLLALWLIHRGRALLGVMVIIAAKLLGTALVGRLFVLLEPQLMTFAWFARAAAWWGAMRGRVMDVVRASAPARFMHLARRRWRVWARRAAR